MNERSSRILLVEPDAELLEILVASLAGRFDAHVTCVADAESCLDLEIVEPHDLVITELDLGDSSGLRLAEELAVFGSRPVVLLADDLSCEQAIEAIRLGISDVFRKPFPVEQLLESVDCMLRCEDLRRRRAVKYRRMRELVRRVIRERRDLTVRMDLICRDLVGAQRKLVHRVLDLEETGSQRTA